MYGLLRKAIRIGVAGWVASGLFSCATGPAVRKPSSTSPELVISRDLGEAAGQFREFLKQDGLTVENCQPLLSELFQRAYQLTPEYFDSKKARESASQIISDLFLLRIELRNSLKRLTDTGDVEAGCVQAIRDSLLALRYVDESIAEWSGFSKNLPRVFASEFPYLHKNPAFPDFQLRSGDILLSRGNAFVSAAIAHMSKEGGDFSHIALVHVDEMTGEIYTIEAHIEVGVVVAPLEKYLTDGKARALVFRHPDSELAKIASGAMFEKARAASATGKNIPYDFQMELHDHEELFCSEVAHLGFKFASEGRVIVPMFQSHYAMSNRSFYDSIGLKATESFAPSDIEVDPRFELVAEWRNLGAAPDARLKDAVLTAMFQWMETYDYRLINTPVDVVNRQLIWTLRRWPLFGVLLKEKLPKNMSAKTLGAMFVLNRVGTALYEQLKKADEANLAARGFHLTPKQMREVLEKVRAEDVDLWRKAAAGSPLDGAQDELPSRFHQDFRSLRN